MVIQFFLSKVIAGLAYKTPRQPHEVRSTKPKQILYYYTKGIRSGIPPHLDRFNGGRFLAHLF